MRRAAAKLRPGKPDSKDERLISYVIGARLAGHSIRTIVKGARQELNEGEYRARRMLRVGLARLAAEHQELAGYDAVEQQERVRRLIEISLRTKPGKNPTASKLMAAVRAEELFAKIGGTLAPARVQVDVEHRHNLAAVVGGMTSETLDVLRQRMAERGAERAKLLRERDYFWGLVASGVIPPPPDATGTRVPVLPAAAEDADFVEDHPPEDLADAGPVRAWQGADVVARVSPTQPAPEPASEAASAPAFDASQEPVFNPTPEPAEPPPPEPAEDPLRRDSARDHDRHLRLIEQNRLRATRVRLVR